MLQQTTPFTWCFTDASKRDLKIHYNRVYRTYSICRRIALTDRFFEVRTLSTHPTLEEAFAASDAVAAEVR